MLLSRTCIFLLIISFSSVITDDITRSTTVGYQKLAAKTDSRRHNTPAGERKGDANAESSSKRKREEKEDKKNRYSA